MEGLLGTAPPTVMLLVGTVMLVSADDVPRSHDGRVSNPDKSAYWGIFSRFSVSADCSAFMNWAVVVNCCCGCVGGVL